MGSRSRSRSRSRASAPDARPECALDARDRVSAALVAISLLGSVCSTVVVVLPSSPAYAEQALDWDALARMEEEGAAAFDRAGDTDLSRAQRNAAIVEAYGLLRRVYSALDAHCDAHPDQVEALDSRMVNINMMVFWLKKDAPISLMAEMKAAARDGSAAGSTRPPDGAGEPGGGSADDAGSGIGGSTRRGDEPPPTPSTEANEPSTGGPAPEPERPDVPASPVAPERSPLENARRHDATKPSDIAGSVENWLEVLATIEDAASPAYTEALARVSVLSARLKDFYRERRDEDPDAVQRDDLAGRESSIAERLSGGLGAAVADERRAAADRLASLGWAPAALAIQSALRRESDPTVREAMFLALVRLGGSRTCETLARFRSERREELALGAVRALSALARKGPVEARYAGASLGGFVASAKVSAAARTALGALNDMGAHGVPGLVTGIETPDDALRLDVVAALGATQDGRAAPALAARLTATSDDATRRALMSAVKSIGRAAVPALIDALKTRKTRRHAAIALYEVTGQPHGEDVKAWQKWWREAGGD